MVEVPISNIDETSVAIEPDPKEINQCDKSNKNDDLFSFLSSLKLEGYFESLVENGAEKLGQLVYVEESVIDQLCHAVQMKIVHTGILKKAIKECQNNMREVGGFNNDKSLNYSKFPQPLPSFTNHTGLTGSGDRPPLMDRRKQFYPSDNQQYYSSQQGAMLQLLAAAQSQANDGTVHTRQVGNDLVNNIRNAFHDETHRGLYDQRAQVISERFNNLSPVSDSNNQPNMLCPDGSYYVTIFDRLIKFPPTVRIITKINKIDQERRDLVRKGAQIYGRDDTKRKNNELTALEVIMNEISYEICLRDFTFMISRQKLLGLVREIIKDNQSQINTMSSINTSTSNKMKIDRARLNNVNASTQPIPDPTPITQPNDDSQFGTDYDIILYHKTHREWPNGLSKERRKYLGRRSSNFELIDNCLFYAKDSKRRRWIFTPAELKRAFSLHHIDNETGAHLTREVTIERISQHFYCKNLSEEMTRLFLGCEQCRQQYGVTSTQMTRSRATNASLDTNISQIITQENEPEFPDEQTDDQGKRRLILDSDDLNQSKKPRKSLPKRAGNGKDETESTVVNVVSGSHNNIHITPIPELEQDNLLTENHSSLILSPMNQFISR